MANKKNNFKYIAVLIRLVVFLFLISALFVPFSTGLKMTVNSSGGDVVTTYKSAFIFMFGGELHNWNSWLCFYSDSINPFIDFDFYQEAKR